jgi:hypothetical protein
MYFGSIEGSRPGNSQGGRFVGRLESLRDDSVRPLARVVLCGFDLQLHLLPHLSAEEPAVWFCQSVAFVIWAMVAPCSRRSSFRTISFLLPARASVFAAACLLDLSAFVAFAPFDLLAFGFLALCFVAAVVIS